MPSLCRCSSSHLPLPIHAFYFPSIHISIISSSLFSSWFPSIYPLITPPSIPSIHPSIHPYIHSPAFPFFCSISPSHFLFPFHPTVPPCIVSCHHRLSLFPFHYSIKTCPYNLPTYLYFSFHRTYLPIHTTINHLFIPSWPLGTVILEKLGQHFGCWCPGSSHYGMNSLGMD